MDSIGLRERTRQVVREQIAEQALALFADRGFDATTIDDIAAAVGISARSFFRYFPSKEDVVIGDPAATAALVRDAFTARPRGEPVWESLHSAFAALAARGDADPERNLRTMRVIFASESLRARNIAKHHAWAHALIPHVEARLRGSADSRRVRAQSVVHAALACFDVALAEWTARDGATPFATLADEAFAELG